MSDSFQSEVPRARVNIALELDNGSGKKKKELPMKLLVVGDFSNGQSEGDLNERARINVNGNNLEKVISNMAPKMDFAVPNRIKEGAGDIAVSLTANNFDSFHPEQVASQIPELSDLLSMRNLLKDLKSNLLDNATLRKEVERILNTQPDIDALKAELKELVEGRSIESEEEAQ